MRLGVRTRLTLWYVLLLAAVVAALGTFVVTRLRTDLVAEADGRLAADARNIAVGYAQEGAKNFRDVSETVLPAGGSVAQVLDERGRVLAAYGQQRFTAAPVVDATVRARALRAGAARIGQELRGDEYRIAALRVRRAGRPRLVAVAESIEPTDDAADRVRTLLLIAGPVALLVIAAGGWWLARKALRPVAEMTERAQAIGIDRLDERIPLPAARDELARLAATLNDMLDRLARGVEERRRLIADASHELRTPLAVMRAELDVTLDDAELAAPAREVLESAREEVDRLSAIVDGLLTLARIDEGRLARDVRAVELRELAETVARRLAALAAEKRVTLVVEGARAWTAADPGHLRRALANLADNAIKAAPRGSEVSLRSWRDGDEAGVTVTDAGAGIPEEARERIFERFSRLDESRSRRAGGSGLGLAICRELVEADGGRVGLTTGGSGSAFTIALPAAAEPPEAERPGAAEAAPEPLAISP